MLPSGRGVGLAVGAGEESGCASKSGVGLALGVGEGVEPAGIVGRAAGVGKGANVGRGAGVPMGEIEGSGAGVGNPDSELVWPSTNTIVARKIPPAANSFLNVCM